jgi:hypothetical protein
MPDTPRPEDIGGVLFFSKGSSMILRILSGDDWQAWDVEEAQAVLTWLHAWIASRETQHNGDSDDSA